MEQKIKIFQKNFCDEGRTIICAFSESYTNEKIKEFVLNYIKAYLLDTEDEYAPIQTENDCERVAQDITDGFVYNECGDTYFIEEITYYK